jgi:hypothetical protein
MTSHGGNVKIRPVSAHIETEVKPLSQEEIDLFVSTFIDDDSDECRCEVEHIQDSCSVRVVARAIWCRGSILMCKNATDFNRGRIERGLKCSGCNRIAALCWKIVEV